MADENLFDPGPEVVRTDLSPDRRRRVRQRWLLEQGIHPATGAPLRKWGTCGTCAHHFVNRRAQTFHKCDLAGPTHGAATDIRVGWPACSLWAPKDGESPGFVP